MKRWKRTLLLALALLCALTSQAFAQTTGVALGDRVYSFAGGEGRYEADGMTFIIGPDSVTVQRPGAPDLVLPLHQTSDDHIAAAEPGSAAESVETVRDVQIFTSESAGENVCTATGESVAASDAPEDRARRFAPYAEYGLKYDAASGALYYQGKRVRSFTDAYALDESGSFATILEFSDAQGEIDVTTRRDMSQCARNADGSIDPSGALIGLYVRTPAESAAQEARASEATLTPGGAASESASEAGNAASAQEFAGSAAASAESTSTEAPMRAAEREAFFAPYAEFGLEYDAQHDRFRYQGRSVRSFLDIRQTNGEPLESGRFHGVLTSVACAEDGEVDLETIRDYSRPDANGDGKLIGLRATFCK